MEVGLLVLGILIGIGLTWYLQDRYRKDDAQEREANFQSRLAAMQGEVKEADAALTETRDRLIALQMEHRAAEQALAEATKLRERCAELEDELAKLKGQAGGEPIAVTPDVPVSVPSTPDDLTLIKGIGKVLARKLHDMGVTTFRQLAELSPTDAHRINEAIDFPSRIEREHWIEQARTLAGKP